MSDLPRGWEWTRLDEVADIRGGIQKQQKRMPIKNKFPFLRVANVLRGKIDLSDVHEIELFDGELEKYRLQHADLLVVEGNGSIDQLGRAALWHSGISDCVHQNHLIRVRTSIGLEPQYLSLVWNSPLVAEQLKAKAWSTSGLHTLNISKLSSIQLPLPPLAEQRRIVTSLDQHLSRLDAAQANIKSGLQRAEVLAKRVIVEAVPIPSPAHWKLTSVDKAGSVDIGRQRHPDWHTGPSMRPYLRVANVFEDRIDTTDVMEMDFPPEIFNRFRLETGDILLNEGQSPKYLGRPAMYRGEPNEVAFTNSLLRFRAGPGVDPEWALLVFRRHLHSERFIREVRITTNIAHLSSGRFKTVEFPIPPIAEQRTIVTETGEKIAAISRLKSNLKAAQRRNEALRSSLLAEAFSGRLVSQDENDEPASTIMDSIRTERAMASKSNAKRSAKKVKKEAKPVQESLL